MNNCVLIGRLTNDIELRKTNSGKSVTSFTIAVGRDKENTDFIPCQVWNMVAENMAKYCSKGDMVAVKGRIQTRNYEDKDGNKRTATEVVADNVVFLSTKKKEETTNDDYKSGNLDVEVIDELDLLPF